jgi:hypothetical protein
MVSLTVNTEVFLMFASNLTHETGANNRNAGLHANNLLTTGATRKTAINRHAPGAQNCGVRDNGEDPPIAAAPLTRRMQRTPVIPAAAVVFLRAGACLGVGSAGATPVVLN